MVDIQRKKISSIWYLSANFLIIVSFTTVSFWIGVNEGRADGAMKSISTNVVVRDHPYLWNGTSLFKESAHVFTPVTDKVTTHSYEIMYGKFLMPYYHLHPNMKMLEIGLGCNMKYGPGASVALWKKIFPQAELWEAEFDAECVNQNKDDMLKDINVVTGDQGNNTDLDRWIAESGGNFDVIIDDGGHQNCQIWTSFQKLWPEVKKGGLYFIEDMQVAKLPRYKKPTETCDSGLNVPDKLKGVVDKLLYKKHSTIEFVFCQSEACVLGKKP